MTVALAITTSRKAASGPCRARRGSATRLGDAAEQVDGDGAEETRELRGEAVVEGADGASVVRVARS